MNGVGMDRIGPRRRCRKSAGLTGSRAAGDGAEAKADPRRGASRAAAPAALSFNNSRRFNPLVLGMERHSR
ncbi:MAG: hypothetical protein AMXMBFR83_11390 [Phycisphaerae bacterium]